MQIKKSEKGRFFRYVKKSLDFVYRGLFNRKTGIVIFILIVIFLFLFGVLFGLIILGFFGSLDNPSQNAVEILHLIGIRGLKDFKILFEGIMRDNVKIPFNWIRALLSNPEKIYIDVGFTNFKKIEYKRQQALGEGFLPTSGADYVPAKIRYKNKEIGVRIRLKGDDIDHLRGDKWSFRIKVKGNDTLFGMKTFSIQRPLARNYVNEFIYHQALKREDVISLRYDFIEVIINGENKGIYAIEEHFEKQLIEDNKRREGVIIKFSDDLIEGKIGNLKKSLGESFSKEDWNYIRNNGSRDWFYGSEIDSFDNEKILENPLLSKQFESAVNLLESFRNRKLATHEVFDVDKLAKYFAINALMDCLHASQWPNIRFYFNPITSRLEPIGFDGNCGTGDYQTLENYLPDYLSNNGYPQDSGTFFNLIFRDKIFFERYIQELEKISKESYLDELFLELDDEIDRNINVIRKDKLFYFFSKDFYYKNQKRIWNRLHPIKGVNIYFQKSLPSQNKIILSVGNTDLFPIEIVNLIYNDSIVFGLSGGKRIIQPKPLYEPIRYQEIEFRTPSGFVWEDKLSSGLKIKYRIFGLSDIKNESVLPWAYLEEDFLEKDFIRQEADLNAFGLLVVKEDLKKIIIKKGNWVVNESLIIPEGFKVFAEGGTQIDLIEGAVILSYSDLQFIGNDEEVIEIVSSDSTGQGIAVLNAESVSNLRQVVFNNLKNPSKKGWELTGGVSFYESPVKFEEVSFEGINAEDSLNIVNSKFEIKDSFFENCFSDCLDVDFGEGVLENNKFSNCGNDCVDFSGSSVNISDIDILNAGDKGVSVGEESVVKIENIEIDNDIDKTYIGVASKDMSDVEINDIKISNCEYGFAVYQKKPEFGGSSVNVKDVDFSFVDNEYILERDSYLKIDEGIILAGEENVFEKLYGGMKDGG